MGFRLIGRAMLRTALCVAVSIAGTAWVQRAQAQVSTTISNQYLGATVGNSGQLNSVNLAGRFGVTEPGATAAVLMQQPRNATTLLGSYVTVRIDGGTPVSTGTTSGKLRGWDVVWGDVETDGTDATGAWLQEPAAYGNRIIARWHVVPAVATDTTEAIPDIAVDLEMTLVHDLVYYSFKITNKDSQAHSVGLRFLQDYAVPPTGPDGPVLAGKAGTLTLESVIDATGIPNSWRAVGGTTATADVVPGSVGGVLLPESTAVAPTVPNSVVFAQARTFGVRVWDVVTDATASFADTSTDGAVALYYNPAEFGPGQSATVTALFGAMRGSYDFGRRLVAGLSGPATLAYDPTAAAGKQLTPNPMKVAGFVHNLNDTAITDIRAVISLPTGLALAAGESAQKTASSVAAGGEASFNWSVVPTGEASGRLTYTMSVSASPGTQGSSVTRDVEVPALPVQTFPAGVQMVSFPYAFADARPSVALGLDPYMFDLLRWDAKTSQYQSVQYLNAGEGYWMRLSAQAAVTLANATPVGGAATQFEIPLRNGWNQIASPYLLRLRWSDVRVINTDVGDPDYLRQLTVDQAAAPQRRWVSPVIFRYDTAQKSYAWDADYSTEIVPFAGYWVRAYKPGLSLIVPKPSGRAAGPAVTAASLTWTGGWRLRLGVTGSGASDFCNYVGMVAGATDGSDVYDVEKPPATIAGVSLAMVDGQGQSYAQDVRSQTGRKVWSLRVSSAAPRSEVTVSWGGAASLPRGFDLTLRDLESGRSVLLRQQAAFTVNTGDTGVRRLELVAAPRVAAGALRIMGSAVQVGRASRAATVVFQSTVAASSTVRVLGANGALVRALLGRAADAGSETRVTWDLKDQKGIAVPAGAYAAEVRATSADGQSARVLVPFVVVR
ncbi:MAG: hypothetical protein NT029_00245 [Armatimonadetes bacterium]|nr:hypothetical protein [Armatimonadota bacterium]